MPPSLQRSRGRLKNNFIIIFVCVFVFLVTFSGYYFFQNSTGAVDPDIARFAIFTYYNLEIWIKNIISWDVPTIDTPTKWKLSKKIPQVDWSNYSGCTPLPDSHLLMAMRTPKAASTTLEDLIAKLSKENHFVVNKVALLSLTPPGPGDEPQTERVHDYCEYFSSLRKRTVSVAHIRYLDFVGNNFPQPVYVGTIRNPVTRMQSHYNYDHFADRPWHISHEERGADTSRRPPTFIECVRAHMNRNSSHPHLPEMFTCLNKVYLNCQLRYFCGMDPMCKRAPLDVILDRALENLNRHFRVVVVVEEMEKSITLLDKLIPTFFGGAKLAYDSSPEGLHSNINTKDSIKPIPPTPSSFSSSSSSNLSSEPLIEGLPADVYTFLANLMPQEMKLYEAARAHLRHNAEQCEVL